MDGIPQQPLRKAPEDPAKARVRALRSGGSMVIEVIPDEVTAYMERHKVEYASMTVRHGQNRGQRLRFQIDLTGCFYVYLDDELKHVSSDLVLACKSFNYYAR